MRDDVKNGKFSIIFCCCFSFLYEHCLEAVVFVCCLGSHRYNVTPHALCVQQGLSVLNSCPAPSVVEGVGLQWDCPQCLDLLGKGFRIIQGKTKQTQPHKKVFPG